MPLLKNIFKAAKREVLENRFIITLAQAAGSSYILSQRLWLSLAVGGAATTLRYALPCIQARSFEPIKTSNNLHSATNLGASYIAAGAAVLLYPDPHTIDMIQTISGYMEVIPKHVRDLSVLAPTVPYAVIGGLAVTQALVATAVGELSALYLQARRGRHNHDPQ